MYDAAHGFLLADYAFALTHKTTGADLNQSVRIQDCGYA